MARDASKERAILLFVALLQTFAYFVPAATWNPVSRFAATRAFASGRLDVGSFAHATGDRAMRDGRWFSDKAPIPALLAVPAYRAVRAVHDLRGSPPPSFAAEDVNGLTAVRLTPSTTFSQLLYASSLATAGLAGAGLGLLLFVFLRRRFTEGASTVAVLVTILGTPIFPYATSFYGHVPAAFALFAAVFVLDVDERESVRPGSLMTAGALLGSAIGCEYLAGLPGFVIGLWALRSAYRSSWAHVMALGAGVCVPLAVIGGYHDACFGSPFRTGYSFLVDPIFVQGHGRGLLGIGLPQPRAVFGLLFGASRGLFVLAPIALVGAVGLVMHLRARRDPAVMVLALAALVMLLANAGYYMWWGGAAAGPRHLVAVLPVLGVGVAHVLGRRVGAPVVALSGLLSVVCMLAFTAVGLEAPEGADVIRSYLLPHLLRGEIAWLRGASNLGMLVGLPRETSLGPLLAFWILAGYSLGAFESRGDALRSEPRHPNDTTPEPPAAPREESR